MGSGISSSTIQEGHSSLEAMVNSKPEDASDIQVYNILVWGLPINF
jgi:hypothetical protein